MYRKLVESFAGRLPIYLFITQKANVYTPLNVALFQNTHIMNGDLVVKYDERPKLNHYTLDVNFDKRPNEK